MIVGKHAQNLLLMLFMTWSNSINRITSIVNSGIINFKWEDYQLWISLQCDIWFYTPIRGSTILSHLLLGHISRNIISGLLILEF